VPSSARLHPVLNDTFGSAEQENTRQTQKNK